MMMQITNHDLTPLQFWVSVLADDTLADGSMTTVQHGQRRLAIYHVEGQYFATDDIRTTELDFLSDGHVEQTIVVAPQGDLRFDIRSGKSQDATSPFDLRTYPVRVERGNVEVLLRVDELADGARENTFLPGRST